ncbi:MAG: hypothetical protein A2Y92_05370 [Chloroflexi bacterium RBG_13_57_8]|nr:MAG: hypothetical protein A2Y92_05370 [Chloroflexi bacterium RBG_13_57_8]
MFCKILTKLLFRGKRILLVMKIFLPIRATPRIYLFFIAVLLKITASALSAVGFVLVSPGFAISGTAVWLAFFAVLLLVASPQVDVFLADRWHWLKPAALTITGFFCAIGILLLVLMTTIGLSHVRSDKPGSEISRLMVSLDNVFGYNDATALTHQAASNLLDGRNPYASSNTVNAMLRFYGRTDKLTPLRVGRFADVFPYPTPAQLESLWQDAIKDPSRVPPELESKFNYPAGCFLLPAAFIGMGIGDLRLVYVIFLIPALGYAVYRVPKEYRLFFIAAVVASVELWSSLAAGETGFLYFPFLLLAWVLYRRNIWASAVFMGIVLATKQVTWFILPFYIIVVWRTLSPQRALGAIGIIAGVFVAANAWFFAVDPQLWLSSIFAPMVEKMFPIGVGIITPVTTGMLDVRSPLPFTILEFVVMVGSLAWYHFNCRRYPETGPVLSMLPLFLAWRSLWGYFFYVDIIILASILINEYGKPRERYIEMALASEAGR